MTPEKLKDFILLESSVMTPEKLKDFILLESSVVSAGVALLTFVGLPGCKKADLVQEILQKEFKMSPEELMKSAEITEKDTEFNVFELGAIREKKTWEWCSLTKRSRYLSCFVSALQRDTKKNVMSFAYQGHKIKLFEIEALDDCFYNLYRLLKGLYHESAKSTGMTTYDSDKIPVKQLTGETTLTLINAWDIGFNRAIFQFLPLLCGHLHHNYPILFLGCPNDFSEFKDGDHLGKTFKIDQCEGMKPILSQYSRVKFLLSFSHLARSYDRKRKQVSQVAAIVHCSDRCSVATQYSETFQHPEPSQNSQDVHDPQKIKPRLQSEIENNWAKKFSVEGLLTTSPWVFDQNITEQVANYRVLKEQVDNLVESEQQKDIPLSWLFLRSAFYKTGELFIKTAELKKHAKNCNITDAAFDQFLKRFTGFGSIIHIPDVPVLCDYVILNPPDFFHKLNELYYPRLNGDLKYGIASVSTLRRLFGENARFFKDVLTAANLAVQIIDSDRILCDDTDKNKPRRLLITEECLYIPSIRTGVKPDKSCSTSSSYAFVTSLCFVYKNALLPTRTSENVVEFLLQRDPNLHLLTCEWYNETRFLYYHQVESQTEAAKSTETPPKKQLALLVKLTMVSHGDKNEMLVEAKKILPNEDVEQIIAEINKNIIRAYCSAEEVYNQHHFKLLGVEPELELKLNCTSRSKYHNITAKIETSDIQVCASCKQNQELMAMWKFASKHWKAR